MNEIKNRIQIVKQPTLTSIYKWAVIGPEKEVQVFRIKKEAKQYLTIRRAAKSQNEAIREYAVSI